MELLSSIFFCMVMAIAGTDGRVELTVQCRDAEDVPQLSQELVRVRLAGIRVPQMSAPHGDAAWSKMHELLLNRRVMLECPGLDVLPKISGDGAQFQKPPLCTAWVAPVSGTNEALTLDVGMALLTVGLAEFDEGSADNLTRQEWGQYSFAQEEARAKKVGIWQVK